MNQLTQQLKSGDMEVLEVAFPIMGSNQLLVKNHCSVISAGTEGKNVSDARKGYIAKAKSRQKEVKMVIESIKSEGLKKTYDVVMSKLEAPSPLGYSCAGEVIAVGSEIKDIQVGDYVACGGAGAYHAEVVSVFRNLCVKVPKEVPLDQAAFSTIASIALQGIRQADLRLGENCTVIGLGLIGLLTVQFLRAAGIKTIGVDIDPAKITKALSMGCDKAFCRSEAGITHTINNETGGFGTDAVIITAGTSSLDPVELAGEICRKKGKVIIVGAVPTGFSRANYYKKELDLRMSSSYGPGRYDPLYEEKGVDYPIGYVRFTENRNMQTFIDLLQSGRIDIQGLISHRFKLEDARAAYDLILSHEEPSIGILLEYNQDAELKKTVELKKPMGERNALNVSFIGAGNFAQNAVLPRIKGKCSFVGISTTEGNMSRYVAEKYGFSYCTDSPEDIIKDDKTGTIFILTRHNTHAEYAALALEHGKNVVVEKPLAMNFDELEKVKSAADLSNAQLMLGFNRRFAPHTQAVMNMLPRGLPRAINIRINAGVVPADHWVHDPQVGGGRIIGETCHFIDLATYLAGAKASTVQAFCMRQNPNLGDTVTINLGFENGSIANVCYFSNGNKKVPKESIEVFCGSSYFHIDDFMTMTMLSDNAEQKMKLKTQDKGHTKQFEMVMESLRKGESFPIPFEQIYHSSKLTLLALESIAGSRTIQVQD